MNVIYLIITALLASCLPQEKTTQCAQNEAFDATQRKCVATLGANSTTVTIANITPASSYSISTSDPSKTHTVTVSDPFNNGYQIRWNLTLPNGSTTLLGTGLSMTFNHTSFAAGTYIMEVLLLSSDGSTVFNSRSWSINVITDITPSITQVTASPFSTTTTSTPTTINATASNPDLIANVQYQWYVNGSAIAGQSGSFSGSVQALAFSFDPTSSSSYYTGANVYTVQLILSENVSGSNYSTATWIINNAIPGTANVTLGSSTTLSTATPNSGQAITVIDELNISSGGFKYDVDGDLVLDNVDLCVQADDINGVSGDGVFVDFLIDGVNVPGATNYQLTAAATSYCMNDIILAGGGSSYFYNLPESVVSESHTMTAVVYDKYAGTTGMPIYNGYTQLQTFNWILRVRQENTPPVITIVDTDAINGTKFSCTTETTTSNSGCQLTQSASAALHQFDLTIDVSDDDYDPAVNFDKFKVEFFINGELLDGATSTVSDSDCFENYNETTNTTRYTCSLLVNPYDTNGEIDPSGLSYTITAKVTDADSPYAAASPKESNTVTWLVSTVNDYNTGTAVNQFAANAADLVANPTYSYLSTVATPAVAIDLAGGAVSEGDIIQFHVSVDDAERDSHTITINVCDDIVCTNTLIPNIVTRTVTSTNDSNPRVSAVNYQISEDEVTTTNQGLVYYQVKVTDADGATDNTVFSLLVNNNNPDPAFNTANFDPAVPSSLIAFTGLPLTIDPGTITDASTADGNTVLYQWLISSDGGTTWSMLNGATERVLVWSPGQEIDFANQTGTAVKLKLCLGDDGVDAAGANKLALNGTNDDCKTAGLDTSGGVAAAAWDVTVFSNMTLGRSYGDNTVANQSDGEIAVWIDPSSTDPVVKYMAYVNNGHQIVIEKIVTSADGTKGGSTEQGTEEMEAIVIDASTDINFASNAVTNLSMDGDEVNGALYIAYMAPISGVDMVHIRRIDISGGKTGFIHDGKFGFDTGYDDLTNNIILASPGIDPPSVNASGLTELTFTDTTANITNMAVTFTGLQGSSYTLQAGVDFCIPAASCTTIAETATAFATAINASTEYALQGLTASASSTVVTLSGSPASDYLQQDVGASTIGQIVVNNTAGRFQLPIADVDLSGADKNKVSIVRGLLGRRIADASITKTSLAASTVQSQELANDLDANDVMILATKEANTGEIALYEIDTTLTVIESNTDLFSGETGNQNVSGLKVAVSKEDTEFDASAFIVGVNINGNLAYARVDETAGDFDLAGAVKNIDLDEGFDLTSSLDNFDITAGVEQYQLMIATVLPSTHATHPNTLFMGQITGDLNPTAECAYDSAAKQDLDKCMKILTTDTTATIQDLPVALGDVLEDVTIGTIGASSATDENIGDFVPLAYQYQNASTHTVPVLGLINIRGITLTSDETSPGSTYLIPYVSP